jgi:hypothetical protein
VQRKQLALLDELGFQRRLLEALQDGDPLAVPGAGLFAAAPQVGVDGHTRQLKRAVEAAHGSGFLPDSLRRLDLELAHMELEVRPVDLNGLDADSDPRVGPIAATGYRESLTLLEAYRVLDQERPIDPAQLVTEPGPELTAYERTQLEEFALRLEDSVTRLVTSRRSDRGFALLVAMARHAAVRESLARGQLVTLDPFPDGAQRFAPPEGRGRRRVFSRLADQLESEYARLRADVFSRSELQEPGYNLLERASGSLHDLRRSLDEGTPLRASSGVFAPSRSAPVALPVRAGDAQVPAEALTSARREEARYLEQLRVLYEYELVGHNCATELLATLHAAFPSAQASRESLGGYLAPGDELSFIPFVFFDRVRRHYPVHTVRTLPSYRTRALAELKRHDSDFRVSLREISPLTSSLYEDVPDEGRFLLFTDDVLWRRPLYGLANVSYALAHTGLGIVTLPLDRGSRVLRGAKGALFSLPELAFFNIRKGSFEYVDAGFSDPRTATW